MKYLSNERFMKVFKEILYKRGIFREWEPPLIEEGSKSLTRSTAVQMQERKDKELAYRAL